LSQAAGLKGKKGVLWWEIHRILKEKANRAPRYLMLENVDRLLKSPASQRGRDFAIMLASLSDLGYAVEWRVINAGEYGMPQRRRRTYILGYKKDSEVHNELLSVEPAKWLGERGISAQSFPIKNSFAIHQFTLDGNLDYLSETFNKKPGQPSPFENSGLMLGKSVWTAKVSPLYKGSFTTLGDILINESQIPAEYFIKKGDLPNWKYLKGGKQEKRKGKDGFEYEYSEGPLPFPDYLDKPSRTMVTGEGGATPSRFKHVIKTPSGKLRRLTPIELERLNMFPDDHTKLDGVSDVKRAFFMGNALVVGVIEKLGRELISRLTVPSIKTHKQIARQPTLK
jgi:DNA (cytosine-5)-methyltransferase 1